MPRYYYHLRTERRRYLDANGRECPDLHEAVLQAYVCILEAFAGPAPLSSLLNVTIDVADDTGSMLFSLPFSSVIDQLSETKMAGERQRAA